MDSVIHSVGQVSIRVHDIERSLEFYHGKLGFPLLLNAGRMAFVQCGTLRLMLGLPEKQEFDHPSSPVYFNVGDMNSAMNALCERGIAFEGSPHVVGRLGPVDVWMAFFRDPDGNLLAIQSEVPIEK